MRFFVVVVVLALAYPVSAVALLDVVCVGITDDSDVSRGAGSASVAELPTFVYVGWPSQADVDSLSEWVDQMLLPLYADLAGPAAYAGEVVIAFDPHYCGYDLMLKRIRISYRPSVSPGQAVQALSLLAHEFSHMWRDVHIIWHSAIEEGLAEATAYAVIKRLPYHWLRFSDRGRREIPSITEDIANRPEVGAVNGLWSYHLGLRPSRYPTAEWLMSRIAAQRQDFFAVFQEEILDRDAVDSTFTQDPVRVVALLRELVPMVDEVLFDSFWDASHLTNLSPPEGDQIFVRGDLIGCYSIRREGWNEVGYAAIPLDWEIRDRFGNLLAQGSITTGTKGQASVSFTSQYRGRISVRFVSHMPNGTQEATVGYWYAGTGSRPFDGLGLFGIVAAESGSVTIETLDRTESYSVPIDRGQFSCPQFEGRDGAFRLVWSEDGVERERIVRKDTAPYLVLLNEGTTTPVGIADMAAPTVAFSAACAPNPFATALRITASQPLRDVAVYSVSGRLVRTFDVQGATTVVWDGRDGNGNHAPAGVYFYRLTASGEEVAGKVTKTN